MPSLSKQLRRLSSGFQVKLPSRKNSEQGTLSSSTLPASTPSTPHQVLALSDSIFDEQPPAYSPVDRRTIRFDDAGDEARRRESRRQAGSPPLSPRSTSRTPTTDDERSTRFGSNSSASDSQSFPKDIDELKDDSDEDAESLSGDEDISAEPDGHDAAVGPTRQDDTPAEATASSSSSPTVFSFLPRELWITIASYLPPDTAASLALANRETAARLGPFFWPPLNDPSSKQSKAAFLAHMAPHLPHHVFCEPCARYHARHSPKDRPHREVLRSASEYIRKPLLASRCKSGAALPATRLTLDQCLPYPLATLTMASSNFPDSHHHSPSLKQLNRTWSPSNSAWADIAQSWTVDPTWTHETRFAISIPFEPGDVPQLLVKVTSTYFPRANLTASEQRLILSSRKDYTANYTTCAHESKGGLLFSACKCALGHIPSSSGKDVPRRASQCPRCRPLYKCMICPTEYQIEIKLVSQGTKFRHALVVTRWTNLGTCRSVNEVEWRACSSELDYQDEESVIWEWGDQRTVRSLWGAATGESAASWKAVPLRRPSHWRSERRDEVMLALQQ
ncbi:MAG: hypothetical protein Q9162_001858 [Coniocarpon cinnabarinum]